ILIGQAEMDVHVGGPVETGRGFVLHSSDYYAADSTLAIDEGVSLTATIDILKAIAAGKGPDKAILALGYAGWRAGQLESEIAANGWLHCPADLDLLFDRNLEQKYERAMSKIGIDPSHLVSEAGHA
ncbi:MAG TPA: YqgE/AlgH family protein, partial [Hyphomicrobiaceae bacterium]|nr:YqgE/AlgH family protein [Hyphomicrobiaceae bacterium]